MQTGFLFLFNAEDSSFCLSFWEGGVKTLENNFFVGKFSVRKTPLFMRLVSEKETKRERRVCSFEFFFPIEEDFMAVFPSRHLT
ncbi:MAG: hypothetical protein II561_03575 [Thermoguttaceae bacterium]|nr:hypothetical protein [Thermoguttaceae bacterium]MBQ4194718.1 hypothetical protein [Thermoguttaceae bacterium]